MHFYLQNLFGWSLGPLWSFQSMIIVSMVKDTDGQTVWSSEPQNKHDPALYRRGVANRHECRQQITSQQNSKRQLFQQSAGKTKINKIYVFLEFPL